MQVKRIRWHQAEAARLCEQLQAAPGTPANRIIFKPGTTAQAGNKTIRRLARHEKAIAKLIKAGIK